MKLYYMRGTCSLAVQIVLEWIGAPYEAVAVTREDVKSPDYLALDPGGTVPLLLDGEFALAENVAILGYLADLHPESRLLGDGTPRGRAEVMHWLGFLNSDVHTAFQPLFKPTRFLQDEVFAGAIAATARVHVGEYLERLDTHLDGQDWLTGRRSVADPYLFVILGWANDFHVSLQRFARLSNFFDRMCADAGVRTAIAAHEWAMPR